MEIMVFFLKGALLMGKRMPPRHWLFASWACLAVDNWVLLDKICRVGSVSVSLQLGSPFQGHVLHVQQQGYYKEINE